MNRTTKGDRTHKYCPLPVKMTFLVLALSAAMTQPSESQAADITVSGTYTLSDAITAANTNADTVGCTGSGTYGDDTIILTANITLAAALTEITSAITIEGGGYTVNGNNDLAVESVLKVDSQVKSLAVN
jgi:hypothetical protein